MSAIFAKYQALVAQYRALQPLPVEAQRALDKKFRLEFNFNSNHIEGNTLTYGETELLLIFDGTKGDHELREYEEMKAHDAAWHLVQDWAKSDRPLTEAEVKELNKVILVRPFWKDAITPDGQTTRRLIQVGDYKEYPNSVRLANGEIFEYASVIDTPIKMGELIHWFHTALQSAELDPLLIAARLHYDFVRIHPFDDGNGRISRLLMNYVLVRHDLPPVIIKSNDKAAYLRALNRADVGDFEAFADYIADKACWSLELCLKASRGESIEEEDDLDKEIEVFSRKLRSQRVVRVSKMEVLQSILDEFTRPVFNEIVQKCSKLSEHFIDSEYVWNFRNGKKYVLSQHNDLSKYEPMPAYKELEKDIQSIGTIDKIDYTLTFRHFKYSKENRDFSLDISLHFEMFSLWIEFNNQHLLEIDYLHGFDVPATVKTLFVKIFEEFKSFESGGK